MGSTSRNPSANSSKRLKSSARYSFSVQGYRTGKVWAFSHSGVHSDRSRTASSSELRTSVAMVIASQKARSRPVRMPALSSILAVPVTAVERLKVAHVRRIRRAERVVVDGPARGVFRMAVAVLLDEPVQELKEV